MPTISISTSDLHRLIGKEMTQKQLTEAIGLTKCNQESLIGEEMTLEITSDRPDLLSAEGIARELKGLLGIETGLRVFKVARSDVVLRIDRSVTHIRPFMSSAVVNQVDLSGDGVRQIMQIQEKIHTTYGRNRRSVSIGIHDLDTITHKLTYAGVEPEKINFTPLNETRIMNGKEILELIPKGREYGHIISSFSRYPLLYDSNGNVLSLPPIINGTLTQITDRTKNILLDVTGTDKGLVDYIVTLMATTLVERGTTIKTVRVISPKGEEITPSLSTRTWKLRTRAVQETLGINLTGPEIVSQLKKMRYGVKSLRKDTVTVIVPPYRRDILHEVDLIEDVVIACGYNRLEPAIPLTATMGSQREITVFSSIVRDLMIGFGFQELFTFVMTSLQILFEKMNTPVGEVVEVENPISLEYSVLRNRLLPGILNFLSYNKHVSYPQRVFECGDVVLIDKNLPTRSMNRRKLGAVISNHIISYEDVQEVLYSLIQNLGVDGWSVSRTDDPAFIKGRVAVIKHQGKELGVLGEIDPTVLESFNLENPVAAFELDVEQLMTDRRKK